MKERPKGVTTIFEVDGYKEIIVVIPTADFNGKYAKECRENIFKGLHMVFVESGGSEDFYFNYAHNCNLGIKKAMQYDPKWIVVSNDDMYKIDEVSRLKSHLMKLSPDEQSVVFTCANSLYHSRLVSVSYMTYRRNLILFLKGRVDRRRLYCEKKFNIKYVIGSTERIYKFVYKPRLQLKYTGSFAIFSIALVRKYNGAMYDEVYLNGTEDIDQSWKFMQVQIRKRCLHYNIGDIIGGTIGTYNVTRRLRGLLNDCYLNSKIDSGELKFL